MLSNLSPRANNAAASSADNLKSTDVDGRAVVSASDAVVVATAAGGAASAASPAGGAGGIASAGTGSTRGSPSMREATSRTAALPIDNALLSATSENSLMTPMAAAIGSVAEFLCRTTLMPAASTIPIAASQKPTRGKARRATMARDDAGLGGCA